MTLLLGPPGSGKSTLLKALAGKLVPDGLRIDGSVTYNGKHFNEFVPQRTAALIEQVDEHIAELTCGRAPGPNPSLTCCNLRVLPRLQCMSDNGEHLQGATLNPKP